MSKSSEPSRLHPLNEPEPEVAEASVTDIYIQVRRIADALEAQLERCGQKQGAHVCGLLPGHRGYHVTLDGRGYWFDE